MRLPKLKRETRPELAAAALIALCFFWGGSGYLVWMKELSAAFSGDTALLISECVGYLAQFVGIALFSFACRHTPRLALSPHSIAAASVLSFIFMFGSIYCETVFELTVGGIMMNLFIGYTESYYLTGLACLVSAKNRGKAFAFAYAFSSVATYAVSLLSGGRLLSVAFMVVMPVSLAMTLALAYTCFQKMHEKAVEAIPNAKPDKKLFISRFMSASMFVFLISFINIMTSYFAEIKYINGAVNNEFARAFYAVGLIAAGILNDRSRKFGLIGCLAALVFPFICLTMSGVPETAVVICILSYIFVAFMTVYRAVWFCDLSMKSLYLLPLAGMGLGIGRLGDGLGTAAGIALYKAPYLMLGVVCALFVAAVVVTFVIYQKFYTASQSTEERETIFFDSFCTRYDLSVREADMLRLVRTGKSNAEIAEALFITESTVKFHIRNILKKTECTNRIELLEKYNSGKSN